MGALERRAATTQQAHSARIQTHTCTCPCSCLVFTHYLRFLFCAAAISSEGHVSGPTSISTASTRDEAHRRARVSIPAACLPALPARQRALKRHRALAGRAVSLSLPCPRLRQQAPDQAVTCSQTPSSHRAGQRNRPLRVRLLIFLNMHSFSYCTHCLSSSRPNISSLALSSLGWDVVATDVPLVVDTVLTRNINKNTPIMPPDSGIIQVRVLDWTVPAANWTWDNNAVIASGDGIPASSDDSTLLAPPFDLILTADTIYSTDLVKPLLHTLRTLCEISTVNSPKGAKRIPPVYLCLERRDPTLVEYVLAEAAKTWTVKQISHKKLAHSLEKGGLMWEKTEWADVEVWTFT